MVSRRMGKIAAGLCGAWALAIVTTPVNAILTLDTDQDGHTPAISSFGAGSATMDISVVGNVLTLELHNTSPTSLEGGMTNSDGTTDNAPGIVGFGFDLSNMPTLTDWTLTAKDDSNVVVTIGEDGSMLDWKMGSSKSGVMLDYLPQTASGVSGALYNPLMVGSSALASSPNYFTLATLTMDFDAAPTVDDSTVFVRMQNVGKDGDGSLKLFLTSRDDPPGSPPGGIPEPVTSTLGMIGLAALGRSLGRRR